VLAIKVSLARAVTRPVMPVVEDDQFTVSLVTYPDVTSIPIVRPFPLASSVNFEIFYGGIGGLLHDATTAADAASGPC
jgi:hypothetical protein